MHLIIIVIIIIVVVVVMRSAHVGVRRHLHQNLPALSVHRCSAQLLERRLATFGDVVQPFSLRSSHPVRAINCVKPAP